MAKCVPVVSRILSFSVKVAEKASCIVHDVLKSGRLDIVEKSGVGDLQTIADRSSQHCIVCNLEREFPQATILAEEDRSCVESSTVFQSDWVCSPTPLVFAPDFTCPELYADVREQDIVVWVDPLDGTKEFTEGRLNNVTILIGIAFQGRPIAGVIAQPFFTHADQSCSTRVLYGVVGGVLVGERQQSLPGDKFVVVTTRSHSNQLVMQAIEPLQPDHLLREGGAGFKILLLIDGLAHAYVYASPGCHRWDTCAPEALLRTVGGCLTDMCGRAYDYSAAVSSLNKYGVLASVYSANPCVSVPRQPAQQCDDASSTVRTFRSHEHLCSRIPDFVRAKLTVNDI